MNKLKLEKLEIELIFSYFNKRPSIADLYGWEKLAIWLVVIIVIKLN